MPYFGQEPVLTFSDDAGDMRLSVFKDRAEFENWLQSQPRELLTLLAARAAMRVLPFTQMGKGEDCRDRLHLPLFCAVAVAWFSAKYPALETDLASQAAAAFSAAFSNPAVAAQLRPFFSPEIFFCHRLAHASEEAARDAIRLAMRGQAGAAAAAAIEWDASAKASGKLVPDILARKLWPAARPRWIVELWKELKQDLLAAQEDWDVWTDWYETRVQGKAFDKEGETAILRIAAEHWEHGPKIVNREIKGFFGRQIPNQRREKRRTPSSAPSVPPLRPAALEPAWSGGRLMLPPLAAQSDSDAVVLVTALKLLREEVSSLAAAADGESAIDLRSIACLRSIAARVPAFAPSQSQLFYLAHLTEFLKAYENTVNNNWPPDFAARFAALIFRFDQTVQQFPKWRDFVSNAQKDQLTLGQAAEVPALADRIIAALRENEARNLIDPAIPAALEIFQAPLQINSTRSRQQIAGHAEASMLLLANDLLLSIDNIAKRTAGAALETKNTAGPDRHMAFANEALSFGDKDAGQANLWMIRKLSKIMASTRTGALHSKFFWLKPIMGLLDPQSQGIAFRPLVP